jgi:hypothetical protein
MSKSAVMGLHIDVFLSRGAVPQLNHIRSSRTSAVLTLSLKIYHIYQWHALALGHIHLRVVHLSPN